MNNEELLEEAKKRYPVGTEFRNAQKVHNHIIHTVVENDIKFVNFNDTIMNISATNGSYGRACIYYEGIWAQIISSPIKQLEYEIY